MAIKILVLTLSMALVATGLFAQEMNTHSVELRTETKHPEESVVEVILGTTPEMPTENGLLILHAFLDSDGNGKRDENEQELENQLTCLIDDVEYTVPAFIPGLKYNGNYQVNCSGEKFAPTKLIPDIFIARRGQIIKHELPCREYELSTN